MAKVKFSILIRGNNKAHWLKILLRKIKNQSLQNYEIFSVIITVLTKL